MAQLDPAPDNDDPRDTPAITPSVSVEDPPSEGTDVPPRDEPDEEDASPSDAPMIAVSSAIVEPRSTAA